MNIDSATLVFFSPTRTTARVLESIALGLGVGKTERIDLTPPRSLLEPRKRVSGDLAILGAPVYGGRIPPEAVRRLRLIEAEKTPAVVVVLYGNREYEDALLELRDLSVQLGFRPIAAGAFIGEHSYNSSATPIAPGRPDREDIAEAERFGGEIRDKLTAASDKDGLAPVSVPGNSPYIDKHRTHLWDMCPETEPALCTLCGTCAAVCPTGAVTVGEMVLTAGGRCIQCTACVKDCPTGARVWRSERILQISRRLSEMCERRKSPELFLWRG